MFDRIRELESWHRTWERKYADYITHSSFSDIRAELRSRYLRWVAEAEMLDERQSRRRRMREDLGDY